MLLNKKEMQLIVRPKSSLTNPSHLLHRPFISGDKYSIAEMFFGNCYKLMQLIPDNFIKLICVDIPYLYKDIKRYAQQSRDPKLWEKLQRPQKTMVRIYNMTHGCKLHWLVREIIRVQPTNRVNAYIWSDKKQGKKLIKLFAKHGVHLSAILIWNKTNHASTNHAYTSDCEYCYYFKQNVKIAGNPFTKHSTYLYPNNEYEVHHLGFRVNKIAAHETIKPLFMNRNFIWNSSKPGDWVLDMFAGSGTTGVASKMLHRNFIGMEYVSYFYELACKRISQPRSSAEKIIDYETERQIRMQKPATVTKKATKTIRADIKADTKRIDTWDIQRKTIAFKKQRKHEYYLKRQQLKAKFKYQMKILDEKYQNNKSA